MHIDKNSNQAVILEAFIHSNKKNLLINLGFCQNIFDTNEKLINCSKYSIESIINGECISCKEGYYPLYNVSSSTNNSFIKCYKSIEGYYLDDNANIFKPCYHSCKACGKGNDTNSHNCLECKNEYIYEYKLNNTNYSICYETCPKQETNSSRFCDIVPKCEKINKLLVYNENRCVDNCTEVNKYRFQNICYDQSTYSMIKSEVITYYHDDEKKCTEDKPYKIIQTQECTEYCDVNDLFMKLCTISYKNENSTTNSVNEKLRTQIIDEILEGKLDGLIKQIINNEGSGIILDEENALHQINSLSHQKNDMNYVSVSLDECEELIRSTYNINDEELIIYKIEYKVDVYNIPIIEYVLFNQNGSKLLNLSICDNLKVEYNIPVSINEKEVYKHDPSSDFYNDECTKYTAEGNVDMTLYDRKNEFNNQNLSLCESKCEFKGYNSSTARAICDCNIKSDMTFSEDDINKGSLISQIQSEKSSSNLGVTKCSNVLSSGEQIKSNGGFFSLLLIIIIFIIVFILFCIKGKSMLEQKIDDVIYKKFDRNEKKEKVKNKNTILNSHKNKKTTVKKKSKKVKVKKKIEQKSVNSKNLIHQRKSIKLNTNENPLDIKGITNNILVKKEKQTENVPDKDNDYELNSLSYPEAQKYDKRTCCDYYCSLIKNKQLFAFTFCSFNDYNSGIIKKFIFFLSFALHYTINALFFNDSNMHQIYEDEGKYNFSYQFPKILISAISSTIILRIMLETLVLTDKSILQVKHELTRDLALNRKKQVLKCINIKFTIFFILNFILLVLFWYYLTCFNAVYENTQIYLIENTAISFGISLFYPFIINILPSALRMGSLGGKKSDNSCLYRTSQFLQLL